MNAVEKLRAFLAPLGEDGFSELLTTITTKVMNAMLSAPRFLKAVREMNVKILHEESGLLRDTDSHQELFKRIEELETEVQTLKQAAEAARTTESAPKPTEAMEPPITPEKEAGGAGEQKKSGKTAGKGSAKQRLSALTEFAHEKGEN